MRRTAMFLGAALAPLLVAGAALAQEPEGPERVALTIYNQNIALVEDVRTLNLPAGRTRQTFPGVSAATVLAANQGVVLRIGDRVVVLRDDGVPTRVIFDEVPENLRPRPTLSVTLDAERAGPRETTLSYLTTGLQWKADYVARFDERAGRLDLTGWITVTNNSGSSFEQADTRVMAAVIRPRHRRPGASPAIAATGPKRAGRADWPTSMSIRCPSR